MQKKGSSKLQRSLDKFDKYYKIVLFSLFAFGIIRIFIIQGCYKTEKATITRITNSQDAITLHYCFIVEGNKYTSSQQFENYINHVNTGEKCVVQYFPLFPKINNLKPYIKIKNDEIIYTPKFLK